MSFTSTIFLFLFFPLCMAGYYLIRKELRDLFLVLASLAFYALGDPGSIWILVAGTLINYLFGLGIGKGMTAGKERKGKQEGREYELAAKAILMLGLFFNFGLLLYYKYFIFSIETVNALFHLNFTLPVIGLPLGISFYTFRTVSYLLDIYWGTAPAQKDPVKAALYVSFFPQVTMGPITRYSEFESQLRDRRFDWETFTEGMKQMVLGLFKKVVFANSLGVMVDYIFAMPHSERTVVMAWLGIIGYLVQLYYDFAGYSDMAIGLGKLFGFRTPQNFDYPYVSKSMAEYWRRWHMTLGTWLKSYIYTPVFRGVLGRKKLSVHGCDIAALLVTWLFSGFWHGAAWHYVVWGLYQFAFIALERTVEVRQKQRRKELGLKKQPETRLHAVLAHVYFVLVLIFGQILFRIDKISDYAPYILSMFAGGWHSPLTTLFLKDNAFILSTGILFCFPIVPRIKTFVLKRYKRAEKLFAIVEPFVYTAALVIVISYSMISSYDPFLYNNF